MSFAVDFKLLFERSSGLYLILDPDKRVVAATDRYCEATGIDRESVVGRHVSELSGAEDGRPGGHSMAKMLESLDRVMRQRRPDAMPIQRFDIPRPQSEGGGFRECYWSPINVPVLDAGGQLRYIIHRAHDVTQTVLEPDTETSQRRMAREQDLVIERLRAANEELAQLDGLRQGLLGMARLNTLSMMASALAHDVSQPLTAAKNYLNALCRRRAAPDFDDTRGEELLTKVSAQIDRASDIVRGLRLLMAASYTVHKAENAALVVGEAVRLSQEALAKAGATLTVDIDPALPAVNIDRVQVQQLIVNLVTNAAEAVAGQARREIHISARLAGRVLRIEVADTGIGLDPDVMSRLGEPRAAVKLIEHGLGLPICRQIVTDHGGELTARPNAPAGTVCTFTLPLA